MKIINETVWRTDHLRAIFQRAAEQELEPAKRKELRIKVVYTRGGCSSGYAWYHGRDAIIRVRHPLSRQGCRSGLVCTCGHSPQQHDKYHREEDGTLARGFCTECSCQEWKLRRTPSGRAYRASRKPTPMTDEQRRELALHVASVAVHEFAHVRGMKHRQMPAYYKWSGGWREYVAWAADMPLEEQPVKTKPKATADDKLAHVQRMKAQAETRVKRAQTILKKWKTRERYYQRKAAAQSVE